MQRQGSRAMVSPCTSSSRQIAHSPASLVSTSSGGRDKKTNTKPVKFQISHDANSCCGVWSYSTSPFNSPRSTSQCYFHHSLTQLLSHFFKWTISGEVHIFSSRWCCGKADEDDEVALQGGQHWCGHFWLCLLMLSVKDRDVHREDSLCWHCCLLGNYCRSLQSKSGLVRRLSVQPTWDSAALLSRCAVKFLASTHWCWRLEISSQGCQSAVVP